MSEGETEIQYLRREIAALREQVYSRDHEVAKAVGYSQGWQTLMQDRFDRLEQRLDNLVLSLLQKPPGQKTPAPRTVQRREGRGSNRENSHAAERTPQEQS